MSQAQLFGTRALSTWQWERTLGNVQLSLRGNSMTKTNLQLVNFINFARLFGKVAKDGKPITDPPKTKWTYALERMEKRLKPQIEAYQEAQGDLQIEHAATDEKGAILTEPDGRFRYTKDGLRARNKAQKELMEKTVEFEPYYATELPENLSEIEKETCAGFVLKEEEAAAPAEEVPIGE